jgi:lipopolysaccharide/colanic/teichoic acid biosynthesis glycosyltransferase/glycosyltransferase involved in cell wall biosynthesis
LPATGKAVPSVFHRDTKDIDIAIPVLNEEKHLPGCLNSVLAFEKPLGVRLSIYVVDGGSSDGTKNIAAEYAALHPNIQVLENPGKIQSCALNIVLRRGTGEYVMRLDAHATYAPDYLMLCLKSALESGADNVGGVVKTLPGADTYSASVVQAITTHRFGVGNSEFRLKPEAGPADTVPFGFFKRELFGKIGYFDERLVRCQDYELNRRITASGGRIWLNPAIRVHYYNQASFLAFLRKQISKEGPYNAFLWFLAPYAIALRHGITGVFSLGILGGILLSAFYKCCALPFAALMTLYLVIGCVAGTQQAIRYREWRHVVMFPFGVFLFHFTHGLGFLSGLAKLSLGLAPVQQVQEPWTGAGRFRAWPIPEGGSPAGLCCNQLASRQPRPAHRPLSNGGFYVRCGKRYFDLAAASVSLVALAIPMLVIAIWNRAANAAPVLFRQQRVGRYGRLFEVYKFRTMTNRLVAGTAITAAGDARITQFGKILRRWKLDELPQLFNVLRGEMSFVGPRPDVPGYMDQLQDDAAQLLELRPGVTGPASLAFRDEEVLLAAADNPTWFNDEVIFPEKVRLNLEYCKNMSLLGDIGCILKTILPGRPGNRETPKPEQSIPASAV